MSVKLKVLHGALQKQGKWQLTVPIRKSPFLIGQATDCQLRCFGRAISDHHCEIRVESGLVFLRDLGSSSGTFVNDAAIADDQPLQSGDQLRLGRLAFELLIALPASPRNTPAFDEFISDMLLEADEADRQQRVRSPEERWYEIEPVPAVDPYEGLTPKEKLVAKARQKLPPKQDKPLRLPRRTYVAGSSEKAALDSLAIYYPGFEANIESRHS